MRTVLNNSIPSQPIRHNLKKNIFNSPIFVKLKIVSREIFRLDQQDVSLTHHLGHLVHKRLRPSRCKPSFRETLPASCDTLLPNADTSYDFLVKHRRMPLRRECRDLGPKSAEKPAVSCVRKIGHGFPYALGSFCSFRICTKHDGLAFIGLSLSPPAEHVNPSRRRATRHAIQPNDCCRPHTLNTRAPRRPSFPPSENVRVTAAPGLLNIRSHATHDGLEVAGIRQRCRRRRCCSSGLLGRDPAVCQRHYGRYG